MMGETLSQKNLPFSASGKQRIIYSHGNRLMTGLLNYFHPGETILVLLLMCKEAEESEVFSRALPPDPY